MGSLLQVAKTLPISGYDIVSAADIEDLIGERVGEPSAEDMLEEEHEEEEKEEEKEKEDELTVYQLTEIFAITEKLKEAICNFDSNSDRRETCINAVQKGLNEYKQMYEARMKKRQQALITRYFSNRDKREDTPPVVVAEKEDDDGDELLVDDNVAPEDLGNEFEGFALADHAPE